MLEIHPLLLLITIVLFLALIFVLNCVVYKPLVAFMDERAKLLAKGDTEAESAAQTVKELEAKRTSILKEARDKAAAIKSEALEAAKLSAQKIVDAKKAEIAESYAKFEADLASQQQELRGLLVQNSPEFKEALAQKMRQI